MLEFEPRIALAVDAGLGDVWFAPGLVRHAFENSWTGPLNIHNTDDRVYVGAGNGGGPRVQVYDHAGNLHRDFFAGDPESRAGVYFVDVADEGDLVPLDVVNTITRWGVWLKDGDPPASTWKDLADTLNMAPDAIRQANLKNGTPLSFVWNEPITNHPKAANLAGKYTWDGRPWEAVNAMAPFLADLSDAGRFVILHELAHHEDAYLGRPSESEEWQAIWRAGPWNSNYEKSNASEHYATSRAIYWEGGRWPGIAEFFDRLDQKISGV